MSRPGWLVCIEVILPKKICINYSYENKRNFWKDYVCIFNTIVPFLLKERIHYLMKKLKMSELQPLDNILVWISW